MSVEDYPFTITHQEAPGDKKKSADSFIKFDIPIDPGDPDGLKSNMQFLKLNSDDPEDVLLFFRNFNKLVNDLETPEGEPRFCLFKLVLGLDAEADWDTVFEEIGDNCGQDKFVAAVDLFFLSKVERECDINTKEWLN